LRPSRRQALAGIGLGLAATGALAAGCGVSSAGKMALWPAKGAPVLRGAVIVQRRRRADIDGPPGGFGGDESVLPAYGQREFDALAEAGANLVVMSFPEFWTIEPPYRRDADLADLLTRQIDMARSAGLFVVVALRSGPGRSDFVFHRDEADTWFSKDMIIDRIWTDPDAQFAWGEMCVDAAALLKGRSEVVGLNLMVEPDSNLSGVDADGRKLDVWSPDRYLEKIGGTSSWKRLAGEIARKVRDEDKGLPLLISPPAFARPDFLPVMGDPPVRGCVWCVHDYEPRAFTHAAREDAAGAVFKIADDGFAERIKSTKAFSAPVFLGEFGAARWGRNVDAYFRARINACEEAGVAWAAFRWPTFDTGYELVDDTFNVTMGNDPESFDSGGAAPVFELQQGWAANVKRPEVAS
jgi:hypothetical protein